MISKMLNFRVGLRINWGYVRNAPCRYAPCRYAPRGVSTGICIFIHYLQMHNHINMIGHYDKFIHSGIRMTDWNVMDFFPIGSI